LIKLIKNRSKTPPETTWRRCGGFNHISCQSYRACAGTSRSSILILCKLGVDDREGSLRLSPRLSLFYSLNSTQTDED